MSATRDTLLWRLLLVSYFFFFFLSATHAFTTNYAYQNARDNTRPNRMAQKYQSTTTAGRKTTLHMLTARPSYLTTNSSPTYGRPSLTQVHMAAAVPLLDRWKVLPSGSLVGTVKDHPYIDDGDVITTSPVKDPGAAKEQGIVETASGSQYRLLTPLRPPPSLASSAAVAAMEDPRSGLSAYEAAMAASGVLPADPTTTATTTENNTLPEEAPLKPGKIRTGPVWKEAVTKYRLTQATIGLDDEYLLAGKAERSTSGKSNIWEAYKADETTGLPINGEAPVCIKISANLEAVSREYDNYRKLSFLGMERGRFVRCYEFFPVAGYDKRFRNQCALVLEKGAKDLKSHLTSKGRLEGKDLRDACIAAAQCVQALHSVGLVWTDLKTENFVVMPEGGDVKGIDLESAMPVGDNPVDYSPEACPPEFATAFLAGEGPYFELNPTYDVWSLGMLMLELSTGRGYFDGKGPAQITKLLRDSKEDMLPIQKQLQEISDDRLKDLLKRCLQKDPKKRPNMAQILLHPYFITSPFSIFKNFS